MSDVAPYVLLLSLRGWRQAGIWDQTMEAAVTALQQQRAAVNFRKSEILLATRPKSVH
jgi:hypothetical protein